MGKKGVFSFNTITPCQIGKMQELLAAGLYKSGLLSESVQQVLETRSNQLAVEFVDIVRKHVNAVSKIKQVVFQIVQDKRPIEEKVKEKFTYVNSYITSQNFMVLPFDCPNLNEAILVNFGGYLESEKVVEWLAGMGLRAGLSTELVDLSNSYPANSYPDSTRLIRYLPVVALGDPWRSPSGEQFVVYLYGGFYNRLLNLILYNNDGWGDGWWFLAFRK